MGAGNAIVIAKTAIDPMNHWRERRLVCTGKNPAGCYCGSLPQVKRSEQGPR
jgi:hypothetical protein